MLDDLAQEMITLYGAPQNVRRLDADHISKWRGRLPNSFLDFWSEIGIGTLGEGSLHFCDPEAYREVLTVLFGADEDFSHADCHILAYSAFGDLYVWSERQNAVVINLTEAWVICRKLTAPDYVARPDRAIWGMMNSADSKDNLFDMNDLSGKPLYKRARKKLGPLAPGEVYGFVPALKLGGQPMLESLHRFSALEHFSILAQLDTPVLMDFKAFPPKPIRPIG